MMVTMTMIMMMMLLLLMMLMMLMLNLSPGDSLSYQNNCKFTTRDKDNDNRSTHNCAVQFHGAWWYHNCFYSNLNGRYTTSHWYHWRARPVTFTQIKMRPM